jgi:hypothetical protein
MKGGVKWSLFLLGIIRICNDPRYLADFSSVPASKDEAQTEFVLKYALIRRNSSFIPVAK